MTADRVIDLKRSLPTPVVEPVLEGLRAPAVQVLLTAVRLVLQTSAHCAAGPRQKAHNDAALYNQYGVELWLLVRVPEKQPSAEPDPTGCNAGTAND